LLSAWVRYAGTARSLSKGGAYTLILIGQVGKLSRKIHRTSSLMLPSGTFGNFIASIPDLSTQVFGTVV